MNITTENAPGWRRILKFRLPIVVASVCIGITGDLLHWGIGLSIAIVAVVQVVLIALSSR